MLIKWSGLVITQLGLFLFLLQLSGWYHLWKAGRGDAGLLSRVFWRPCRQTFHIWRLWCLLWGTSLLLYILLSSLRIFTHWDKEFLSSGVKHLAASSYGWAQKTGGFWFQPCSTRPLTLGKSLSLCESQASLGIREGKSGRDPGIGLSTMMHLIMQSCGILI